VRRRASASTCERFASNSAAWLIARRGKDDRQQFDRAQILAHEHVRPRTDDLQHAYRRFAVTERHENHRADVVALANLAVSAAVMLHVVAQERLVSWREPSR
jgi:hypothetical protein